MSLPISIETLLSGKAVENNWLEFKEGWNPDAIYRTICAFANDFEDTGGGYIVIGVKEENGKAVRPVLGINPESVERIEREMVNLNNLIQPYYQPRLFVEEVDGKTILVIKASAGDRRPYKVPDHITNKQKTFNYYIRYNSSSIVARNEYEIELINLANRVPFDDRGNSNIQFNDISTTLLRDFLVEAGSDIASQDLSGDNFKRVLEQMDLLEGSLPDAQIKNVAAMMFCDHPEKFFKTTQVDIVIFPEGREGNPNLMIEVPTIKGNVPRIIRDTLSYIRNNVIKEQIIKPKDSEKSIRIFNYPYQAIEEAVVNALYHRDYTQREPVEITIEPDRISILSFAGPNRTITMEAIKAADSLRSRRYTNRRLGEFLKELDLTEGRATGIPTIQRELSLNGSPRATIETDEERTYFLIDIPCHTSFKSQVVSQVENIDIEQFKKHLSQVLSQVVSQVEMLDYELLAQTYYSLKEPMSQKALMELMHQTNRGRFKRTCLDVLLKCNLIEMTVPDKLTSSKQKYVAKPFENHQ